MKNQRLNGAARTRWAILRFQVTASPRAERCITASKSTMIQKMWTPTKRLPKRSKSSARISITDRLQTKRLKSPSENSIRTISREIISSSQKFTRVQAAGEKQAWVQNHRLRALLSVLLFPSPKAMLNSGILVQDSVRLNTILPN